MADLKTICPYDENDIVIPESDLKMAIMFKSKSDGKALVSCPDCCRVFELVPDKDKEWIPDMSKRVCVPFLDDAVLRIPVGIIKEAGEAKYRPGSSENMLTKREYMFAYGIDPECYFAKKRIKNRGQSYFLL